MACAAWKSVTISVKASLLSKGGKQLTQMMGWHNFTERARCATASAQDEAVHFGQSHVDTEHLFLGLLQDPGNVASRILDRLGVSIRGIRRAIERQLTHEHERVSYSGSLSPIGVQAIEYAYQEARQLGNDYIGTEHLLLGVIHAGGGIIGPTFAKYGIQLERTRHQVEALWNEPIN